MREFLIDMMPGILDGSVPLRTAKEIHLTAHRVVTDKQADCRMFEIGLIDERLRKSLQAMEACSAGRRKDDEPSP